MLNDTQKSAIEKLGGKHWEKNGFDRYYFNVSTEYKVYFDVVKEKWVNAPEDLIAKYNAFVSEKEQLTTESSDAPIVKDGKIYYKGYEVKYGHSMCDGDFLDCVKSFSKEENTELKKLAYSMQDREKLIQEDMGWCVENQCRIFLSFGVSSYNSKKFDEFVAEKTAEFIKLENDEIRALYEKPTEFSTEMRERERKMKKMLRSILTREDFVKNVVIA